MVLYLDGDSCPREVRDLAVKAAQREKIAAFCYANRPIPFSLAQSVQMIVVENSEGAADAAIIEKAVPGDLVLTRDIPLAATLVERGVSVINDRGDLYTTENIRERLSLRNFMAELNAQGLKPESTARYGKKEWDAFVRSFDRVFMKLVRQRK